MVFIVYVATDVGHGKINTGVEFDERPATLRDLVVIVEQLYSKEKQMQLNDNNALFRCVSVYIKKKSSISAGNNNSGISSWVEVTDIRAIESKCQLFLFDWKAQTRGGPVHRREVTGGIPTVQFTVKARQLKGALPPPPGAGGEGRGSAARVEEGGGTRSSSQEGEEEGFFSQERQRQQPQPAAASAASSNRAFRAPSHSDAAGASSIMMNNNSQQPRSSGGVVPAVHQNTGEVYTPRPESSSTRLPKSSSSGNGSSQANSGGANLQLTSQLPQEALDFLFKQLCRHSREYDQHNKSNGSGGPGTSISTQRLHTICMENEVVLSTDIFSVMVHHKSHLAYGDWHTLVAEYGPVVDVLYDRLCNKDDPRRGAPVEDQGAKNALLKLKEHIHSLEDEEQELIARQARVKQQLLDAKRRLKEAEEAVVKEEAAVKPDRTKESEMLRKFVDLRVRQVKLHDEEVRVNHELSLL